MGIAQAPVARAGAAQAASDRVGPQLGPPHQDYRGLSMDYAWIEASQHPWTKTVNYGCPLDRGAEGRVVPYISEAVL